MIEELKQKDVGNKEESSKLYILFYKVSRPQGFSKDTKTNSYQKASHDTSVERLANLHLLNIIFMHYFSFNLSTI